MKTPIEVKSREEGRSIRAGLEDPQVRAFVIVMGALLRLPSDRSRARVLGYVSDKGDEERTGNSQQERSTI
jgi:hypothetical protein